MPARKLPQELKHLAQPLESACQLLDRCATAGMVIGAVAVALHARPRQTADVDLLLWCPDAGHAGALQALAAPLGLEPRLADAVDFAQESRVLLRHSPTQVDVDIALAQLEFEEEAIARRCQLRAGKLTIPTVTPEDLIVMKAVANRPQDWLDIRSLIEACPRLDRDRVLKWVEEFARALDTPELTEEVRRLLPAARPARKRRGRGQA